MNVKPKEIVLQFIRPVDDLSILINEKANLLFKKLRTVDVQQVALDDFARHYFLKHHAGRRVYFSIESSADIIYRSLKKKGLPLAETTFIDYGAGLGTLFLLAGLLNFKAVVYNDHLESWSTSAKALCDHLQIQVSAYVCGDIEELLTYTRENCISIDILASRNVIEHIYRLENFYGKISQAYPAALIYSTTTANYHNPAMRLKHHRYHRKIERQMYRAQRAGYIKGKRPGITETDLSKLVAYTRGKAFADLDIAIDSFFNHQPVLPVPWLSTNTCDCLNGVWAEHLLPKRAYAQLCSDAGYSMEYTAGFWDTHYRYGIFNFAARYFNSMIKLLGKKAYWLSPFVHIVACRK